jgi:hypothetical protein
LAVPVRAFNTTTGGVNGGDSGGSGSGCSGSVARVGEPRRLILGIETSCDETAVAVVDSDRNVLSHGVASQWHLHREYGGVFPR